MIIPFGYYIALSAIYATGGLLLYVVYQIEKRAGRIGKA